MILISHLSMVDLKQRELQLTIKESFQVLPRGGDFMIPTFACLHFSLTIKYFEYTCENRKDDDTYEGPTKHPTTELRVSTTKICGSTWN